MADFTAFALAQLPPAPARVLEVGCGDEGGIVPALVAAGYDAIGVDPRAPAGERYRQSVFQDAGLAGDRFDAVVDERALHHVHPLGESLDRLASFAPLLVVDDFSWDAIDAAAQDWYERQHRSLVAAGGEPDGPPGLDEWRARVQEHELHRGEPLRAALRERWDEVSFEARPYLYRWLGGPSSEALEQALVDSGAIPAIGWRWVGRAGSESGSG
jgi:hypothetical protein